MTFACRWPFWLALLASLLLHGLALILPGWNLPAAAPDADTARLAAILQTPRPPPPSPAPVRAPRPRPSSPPALAPQAPGAAPADTLGLPAPAVEAPPPDELPALAPDVAEASAPLTEPVDSPAVPAVPPASTFADFWPREGRLVYQVIRGEDGLIVGQAEHHWQHDGEHYELRATTETTGLAALFRPARVVQSSRGRLVPSGLQPEEFRTERDGKAKDSVRFDSGQGRILLRNGVSADFAPGTQDLLSLFYTLSGLPAEAGDYALAVATGRKVSGYRARVAGTEQLETPLGVFPVRHLRIVGTAVEDATEIWYHHTTHLPLKIRHRDRKGEIFDQVILHIQLKEPQ